MEGDGLWLRDGVLTVMVLTTNPDKLLLLTVSVYNVVVESGLIKNYQKTKVSEYASSFPKVALLASPYYPQLSI